MKRTGAYKDQKARSVSEHDNLQDSSAINFPVVGIGASAGGLEALEQFF